MNFHAGGAGRNPDSGSGGRRGEVRIARKLPGFFDGWCGAAWNAGVNAAGGKADWLCVLVENREKTLSV